MEMTLRRIAMKTPLGIAVLVLAAGCATQGDTQVAQAECKVYPITTASAAGRKPNASPLEQRHAEMQLASSDYRMRQLRERGYDGNVEQSLRDCAMR
jgi:hypothetical protein